MDSIDILATCQVCGAENAVTITTGDRTFLRCPKCKNVLLNYVGVAGYIYVLSNPRMKGLFKIGFSVRPVQERIAELNAATGVPAPFELEAAFISSDPKVHEQQIHIELEAHRIQGKEFFEVHISKALQVAESICKRTPIYLNPRNGTTLKSHGRADSGGPDAGYTTRDRILRAWRRHPW